MSGIAGSVNCENSFDITTEMIGKMFYRGPDNRQSICDEKNSIGMCQLQIRTPLSIKEEIPYWFEEKDSWISYDGEIYGNSNRKYGKNEAEVLACSVLRGYNIDGMTAISILNRSSNEVFLFRDNRGIKPLYIRQLTPNSQIFCSEMKPLIDSNVFSKPEINETSLFETICFGSPLENRTIYQNIFSAKPGCLTTLTGDKIVSKNSIHRYESNINSDLLESVYDAISNCLVENSKIGLAISGGIDSTIIAHILNDLEVDNVDTISINTEGIDDGITSLKELELPSNGVWTKWKHHVINFNSKDFTNNLYDAVDTYGSPSYMSSLPLCYALAKAAHEIGIVVLLTGEGADELFLGYDSYLNINFSKNIQDGVLDIILPSGRKKNIEKIIGNDAVNICIKNFQKQFPFDQKTITIANYIRKAESLFSLEPLLKRLDHCFMKFSVEGRTPFLHGNIPILAESLDYNDLIIQGNTKYPLRKLLGKLNPKTDINKKKVPFRSPITHWFSNELSDWVNQTLRSFESIYSKFEFDIKEIQESRKAMLCGDIESAKLCYLLITLGIYFRNAK